MDHPPERPSPAELWSESARPLVEALRDRILREGPIPFATFMEVALYDPEHGYYATSEDRATRAGDFLTAPETHPVFGWTVGRALEQQWETLERPRTFTLRELGAGSGVLGRDVIRGLQRSASPLLDAFRYDPVEVTPERRGLILEHLGRDHLGEWAWSDSPEESVTGCVLANEYFDALPVHRLRWRSAGPQEIPVGWDGQWFQDARESPAPPALVEPLAAVRDQLLEGQELEVRPAAARALGREAGHLAKGNLVVLDYGGTAGELYRPQRMRGTLLGYRGHRVEQDPYRAVGRQDLTAHVDFTALQAAGDHAGLKTAAFETQSAFLVRAGLEALIPEALAAAGEDQKAYLTARSSIARLVDPRHMGGFRVLTMARG